MNVRYLETSALLCWLFDEPDSRTVIKTINDAELICTSELTRIETLRALARAHREKIIDSKERTALTQLFDVKLRGWFRMSIDESVVSGAAVDFPIEPVRSLDAIHLATALEYKKLYPDIKMVSLDERIQRNAKDLML